MASDISAIIQNEIINTFESLLSVKTTIDDIFLASNDDTDSEHLVKVDIKLKAKELESNWNFYIPSPLATKFEYHMLGGMGDLKSSVDDEVLDATKEIISTVCGSISTTIEAQGFEDLSKVQLNVESAETISGDNISNLDNLYKFELTFNDEALSLFIEFDTPILEYLGKIVSGEDIPTQEEEDALEALQE